MHQQTVSGPIGNQLMPDWSAILNPRSCEDCGHTLMPSGMDWLTPWNDMLNLPLVKEWSRMWGGMLAPATQNVKPGGLHARHHQHHSEHKHTDCCSCNKESDCHCRCCVVDADLLVYARLGERRVVPVTIENNVRREQEVELELSDWTTHSKESVRVEGRFVTETKFTLKPCEDKKAAFVVAMLPQSTKSADNKVASSTDSKVTNKEAGVVINVTQPVGEFDNATDVNECTVFYSDLRVKGCDIRPIRIALAILPRDCDDYRINCRCGCCC
jgi:hypothetical protein